MARRQAGLLAAVVAATVLTAAACSSGGSSSSSVATSTGGTPASAASTPAGGSTATTAAVPAAIATKPTVTVPSGAPPTSLVEKDLVVGTGPQAAAGQTLEVQYVGVSYATGKQFDASWDDGPGGTAQPFTFQLGAGQVIKGWDEGIAGMRVGGRRELIIPPDLAYGSQSQGPITPNETLVFVVDLLSVH